MYAVELSRQKSQICAYTSPGLFALGPGRFSHRGVTTTRLMLTEDYVMHVFKLGVAYRTYGRQSFAIARAADTTAAAPPEDHYINLRAGQADGNHSPMSPRINFMPYANSQLTETARRQKQVQTAGGFKLIPPESKVMPLPTKAMGWSSLAAPL